MRRLRALVRGLPADSQLRLQVQADQPPALPQPMQRGRTSAETIRRFGGKVIEVA